MVAGVELADLCEFQLIVAPLQPLAALSILQK